MAWLYNYKTALKLKINLKYISSNTLRMWNPDLFGEVIATSSVCVRVHVCVGGYVRVHVCVC